MTITCYSYYLGWLKQLQELKGTNLTSLTTLPDTNMIFLLSLLWISNKSLELYKNVLVSD